MKIKVFLTSARENMSPFVNKTNSSSRPRENPKCKRLNARCQKQMVTVLESGLLCASSEPR